MSQISATSNVSQFSPRNASGRYLHQLSRSLQGESSHRCIVALRGGYDLLCHWPGCIHPLDAAADDCGARVRRPTSAITKRKLTSVLNTPRSNDLVQLQDCSKLGPNQVTIAAIAATSLISSTHPAAVCQHKGQCKMLYI